MRFLNWALPGVALLMGMGGEYVELSSLKAVSLGLAVACVLGWLYLQSGWLIRLANRYRFSRLAGLVLVALILVGALMLSIRPRFDFQFDMTQTGSNSLSSHTIAILDRLTSRNASVEVRAYLSSADARSAFTPFINRYRARMPEIRVEVLDPDLAVLQAKKDRVASQNEIVVEVNDRVGRVQIMTESRVSQLLLRLSNKQHKKMYFLTGHGEPSLKSADTFGLSKLANELRSSGLEVESLMLAGHSIVPVDASVVVLCGPTFNYSVRDRRALEDYISRGGSLVVLIDAMRPVDVVNDLLGDYGLTFSSDFVVLENGHALARTLGQNTAVLGGLHVSHPIVRGFPIDGAFLVMSDARSLQVSPKMSDHWKIIATSSEQNIVVKDAFTVDDLENVTTERILRGEAPLIAVREWSMAAGTVARLIVAGSSSFLRNSALERGLNRDLALNLLNHAAREDDVISVRENPKIAGSFSITSSEQVYFLLGFSSVYPMLFLLIGWAWTARRRHL